MATFDTVANARNLSGKAVLTRTAALWFSLTLIGQWVFAYFIIGFYGAPTLQGHFEDCAKNKALIQGFALGDNAGIGPLPRILSWPPSSRLPVYCSWFRS